MRFNTSMKLYVPSTRNVSEVMPQEEFQAYTDNIVEEFTRAFGGATVYAVKGSYLSSDDTIVTEDLNVVEVFVKDLVASKSIDIVHEKAKWLRAELNQECISIELNGNLILVY